MTTLKQIKTVAKSLNSSDNSVSSKSERKVIDELKKLGFYFIGSGMSRDVYGNGKYVVKIESSGCDGQNKKEVENYFSLSKEEKNLFPEIIDYDKSEGVVWIIAEEAVVNHTDEDTDWNKIEDKLEAALEKLNLSVPDIHYNNIGISKSDGRPVVVDIGIGTIKE